MKRLCVALTTLCLLAATTAWAKTTRVRFPAGRTTVILKGRTTGGPSESPCRVILTESRPLRHPGAVRTNDGHSSVRKGMAGRPSLLKRLTIGFQAQP